MLNNLRDIADNEIADIVGTISGMGGFHEGEEQYISDELKKCVNTLMSLAYQEAMNDIKCSADKLIQEREV
ncbi:hypothetical protein [Butyrivibrio proteoclasticus]|uniref:hypothetical protein n=1 Tax=Butyrivibrio proteoclasticus TaxID=43305 RepID=UPI00047EC947|nr:hypothetical protein [Butyrivibrio proteoclasticus]